MALEQILQAPSPLVSQLPLGPIDIVTGQVALKPLQLQALLQAPSVGQLGEVPLIIVYLHPAKPDPPEGSS